MNRRADTPEELLDALPPSELLAPLPAEVRDDLRGRWHLSTLQAGETLFRQGDAADALYRLVSGRVEVLVAAGAGRERRVADAGPGAWIGTRGVVTGDPRRATVRVKRDAVIARLDLGDVRTLLRDHPAFLEALARFAVRRAAEGERSTEHAQVIAVVPASRTAPVRAFAEALREALASQGTVRLVGQDEARAGVDADAPEDRMDRWLDAQETRARHLLLVAEARDAAWTRRCLRNADRVLLVADVGGDPVPLPRPPRTPRRELVLLHPDHTRVPRGTASWLKRFRVDAHHHVRLGRADDVGRVARFVSGQAIGLALAGGAGRGVAHIGVIEALQEEGVPIDAVSGTSMGGLVGAQLALGWTAEEMFERTKAVWCDPHGIDPTLPVVSVTRGRALAQALEQLFAGVDIEDLWLPFGCVSTSLARAERVVHRQGGLVDALRATSALPGLMPPVRTDDDLLVDGAFVDNLPEDLARELGAGRTLAVNVLPAIDPVFVRPRRQSLRSKARRFNPFSPDREPMIHDIVMRAYFVPTVLQTDAVRAAADVFIEPPLSSWGAADRRPETFDAVHAAGYHEALRVLREQRARGVHLGS